MVSTYCNVLIFLMCLFKKKFLNLSLSFWVNASALSHQSYCSAFCCLTNSNPWRNTLGFFIFFLAPQGMKKWCGISTSWLQLIIRDFLDHSVQAQVLLWSRRLMLVMCIISAVFLTTHWVQRHTAVLLKERNLKYIFVHDKNLAALCSLYLLSYALFFFWLTKEYTLYSVS